MDQLYLSNNGRGPGVARVVDISDGIVTLERKTHINSTQHWERFTLPEKFFRSDRCGWKQRTVRQTAA